MDFLSMTFAFLPGFFLSAGAFLLPPLTWTSCPSINISSFFILTDACRRAVKRYKTWVCLCLFGPSAKWSGWMESVMSLCSVQGASSNDVQMPNLMSLGTRYLFAPHDLMALGALTPRSQFREKTSHYSVCCKCKHAIKG